MKEGPAPTGGRGSSPPRESRTTARGGCRGHSPEGYFRRGVGRARPFKCEVGAGKTRPFAICRAVAKPGFSVIWTSAWDDTKSTVRNKPAAL